MDPDLIDISKNGGGTNEPICSLHGLGKRAWQDDAFMLQLLANNPTWAKEVKDRVGGQGSIPLQKALAYGASPKVVRALLDAYPEAAKMQASSAVLVLFKEFCSTYSATK